MTWWEERLVERIKAGKIYKRLRELASYQMYHLKISRWLKKNKEEMFRLAIHDTTMCVYATKA